jgi:hypothetical protein
VIAVPFVPVFFVFVMKLFGSKKVLEKPEPRESGRVRERAEAPAE